MDTSTSPMADRASKPSVRELTCWLAQISVSGKPTTSVGSPDTKGKGLEVTEDDVVEVILEEVATAQARTVADLRSELAVGGTSLPIDSLALVEIILALEERLTMHISEDATTAKAMGSVRAFARRILQIQREKARERRGA